MIKLQPLPQFSFLQRSIFNILFAMMLVCTVPGVIAAQVSPGFTIDYQDFWPSNDQLKFIRIVIKPIAGVSPSDRDFYVVATQDNYRSGVTSTTTISIRKGDSVAVGELYVPYFAGNNFTIHTELDGDGRYGQRDFAYHNYYEYQNNQRDTDLVPRFIVASSEVAADESLQFNVLDRNLRRASISSAVAVTKKFPAMDDVVPWYQNNGTVYGSQRASMTFDGLKTNRAAAMSLAALPSKWFGYEGLDMVMITSDDLAALEKSHPAKLLALERWVAASGRLVVLNCGDKLQRIEEVLKRIGDTNQSIRDNRECRYSTATLATRSQIGATRQNLMTEMQTNQSYYLDWSEHLGKTMTRIKSSRLKPAIQSRKKGGMISIDFGLGSVVCLSDATSDWGQQTNKEIDQWGEVAIFLQATKSESDRSGLLAMDFERSLGFPELLEPPRYVFEFSIVAYLLAVGPIAFFVLKNRNRLNLMFVVVPMISFVVCSAILAWAVFAEGFDTRVNLFTYTELDQKTGRQVTSSIAHVYSGTTPSPYQVGGATYGVVNMPYKGQFQQLAWSDQGEEISGGDIKARTNHQLRTRCSNETDQRLEFSTEGAGESETASVRNGFETNVAWVAFRSKSCGPNEIWVAQAIGPDESVKAKRMKASEALSLFHKLLDQRITTIPENQRSTRYGYIPSEQYRSVRQLNTNLMKTTFRRNSKESYYLALTDDATNFDPEIENAVLESEIHFIKGVR